MALSKIQAESMNLADTYAFTGTVTGAGVSGKILQVVSTSSNAMSSHSRDADITAYDVTITPSSASSKMLINCSMGLIGSDAAADTGLGIIRIVGASSTQIGGGSGASYTNATFIPFMGTGGGLAFGMSFMMLDTPSTTSSITYRLNCLVNSGRTLYVNRRNGTDYGSSSHMTVFEVSA